MPSPRRPAKNRAVWSALLAGDGLYIGKSFVPVRGFNRDQRLPFSPGSCHETGPISFLYIPSPASRALPLLYFSWPERGELCGALAHLLCTWGVWWNIWATLVNLCPLETRPPSSIFPEICLGLAVRHVPSPSSPPSITRADLVASTTVVSLLFLSSFWKEKILTLDSYLSNFVTFIIPSYYIVRWFWYPPPSALVLSMIRMWYILSFHNYWFIYCLWQLCWPTWHGFYLSRRLLNRKFQSTLLSKG